MKYCTIINIQKRKTMEKILQAKSKTKRKSKKSESQVCKKARQMVLHKLQQIVESHTNDNPCELGYASFDTRDETQAVSFPMEDTVFQPNTNKHNENIMSNNYSCYRCRHFLKIPQNLHQPVYKKTATFIGQCEVELTFIQAIVWLKSITACVSHISVERLQQIFNKQWNMPYKYNTRKSETLDVQGKNDQHHKQNRHADIKKCNYFENMCLDNFHIKQLEHPVNEHLTDKENSTGELTTSLSINFLDVGDLSYITPQSSHATSQDIQNSSLESSTDDQLTLERCIITENRKRKKEFFPKFTIIPDSDPDSSLESSTDEQLTLERCIITENRKKKKEFFPKLTIIPDSDPDSLLDSNESLNMFEDPIEYQNNNEHLRYKKDTNCLTQSVSENNVKQINKKASKSTTAMHMQDKYTQSSSSNYYCKNVSSTEEGHIVVSNKFVSVARSPSIESDKEYNLHEEYFTPVTSQFQSSQEFPLISEDNTENLVISQIDNMPQFNNEIISWKQKNSYSSHVDQIYSRTLDTFSNSSNSNMFEIQTSDNSPNISINTTIVESLRTDSAYNTLDISIQDKTTTKTTCTKQQRYELRSYKNKTITCKEQTDKRVPTESPSIIQKVKKHQKQECLRKKREQTKNLVQEEEGGKTNLISTRWLNFTLESLNIEYVILESIKVILSKLVDEEMAQEYMIQRFWKNTLREEAINAVLNISDIFRIEKKPNICKKEIVTIIIKTLDEIATCVLLNKTSVWLYRIQIVLELCNSLPICIQIIDYLIEKVKLFRFIQSDTMKVQKNMHRTINQLHLIFYALGITLQKYRTIIPNDRRCRSAENAIPHVSDLWKAQYINEELQDTNLNVDDIEKRWTNALEDFSVASTKNFVQFAEKSSLLIRLLV